jgi:hypothetical protein
VGTRVEPQLADMECAAFPPYPGRSFFPNPLAGENPQSGSTFSCILFSSRAGGREPEAAKQPETAEEFEELRRPNGRKQSSIAQRAQVHRKPSGRIGSHLIHLGMPTPRG